MLVRRYEHSCRDEWDRFIAGSKNGTFLFMRDYMEYHKDRFADYSLMFYDEKGRLIAVMPASVKHNVVASHGGLTYGGVVSGADMKTPTMLRLFDALLAFMRDDGKERLLYKAVPHLFHLLPAEEDLYALFVNGANLYRRDASSAIFLPDKLKFAKGKREGIRKALNNRLQVRASEDYAAFFEIGKKVMGQRHNLSPVHTSEEMVSLARRFPEGIRLHASFKEDEMLAGVITFIFRSTVHVQYMYNSDKGLEMGALDIILDHLINEVYAGFRYLSFGISTEKEGKHLNEGLIQQKEMFGARSVVHDFYELEIP